MTTTDSDRVEVSAREATEFLTDLLKAAGVEQEAATVVAEGLVEADLQGAGSHGMLQAPNYLRRIRAGTISREAVMRLASRSGAVSVFDAGLALGHATARQVVEAAIATAGEFGISAAAVRSATHFGIAGRHARLAAEAGMVGIVMCNTRPMLPAPGGTHAVVGNNPLAIAVPSEGRPPIVFDMAMSAAAMGKIRLAAERGEPIAANWALDAEGRPTTDAGAALKGMLLPAAGAKGFGLALMIDFLCALSGGSAGSEVAFMYGDAAAPADCSWLFLVIDPSHFGLEVSYGTRVAQIAQQVLSGTGPAATEPASLPGDRKLEAARNADGRITLPRTLVAELERLSVEFGGPAGLGSSG